MAAAIVVVAVFVAGQVLGLVAHPIDFAYSWEATNFDDLYGDVWGADAWFVYPPAWAQIVALVRPLGLDVVMVGWELGLGLCLVHLVRGWALPLIGLALVYVATGFGPLEPLAKPFGEVLTGNVQLLMLVCIVAGFRYPALWAVPVLTKVSPIVGLGWFAVRGEWRSLATALGVIAGIAAVSFFTVPQAWAEWIEFVVRTAGARPPVQVLPIPLLVRFPIGLVLLVWGARTDRRWTVPVAVLAASPSPYLAYTATLVMTALVLVALDRDRGTVGEPASPMARP
jgi:hypothetical protein